MHACFLMAVVTRHQARVIWLEYEGAGPIDQTLMLIGKVTSIKSAIFVL